MLCETICHECKLLQPTCGYYFTRDTVNKKVRIGVPPSDLVKWRSDYTQYPQKQA